MKITVVQPKYYAGENPDKVIADFLLEKLNEVEEGSLIVLPEYSNAGGLSEKEKQLAALGRAKEMLNSCSKIAKEKKVYVCINVLEERNGKIKNSTYLYGKNGEKAFVYDKVHLPPSEVSLGIERGNGECIVDLDGIRFAFMTCYDVYYNEQIEYVASHKPDVIIIPGYQRGERTDIILAQNKLAAFRTNAYIARSSFSMDDENKGGNSMIVSPNGEILANLGKEVGSISVDVDIEYKYMRSAGFGCGLVRNDDFINNGLCPEIFK